jgi:nucleotide-binding universal stress UspA family protein
MRDRGPILVPLDGSELAEGALPYAVALAKALGERVTLLTVWEGTESELGANFPSMAMEIEAKARAYFGDYLRGIEARLVDSVPVQALVREGDATEEIKRTADELGARALVVATHGRSGIGRWFYGSTASHLLRHSTVPVLAVGPRALEHPKADVSFKHIMTPLDGTPLSEAALPDATALASKLGARLSLVRVVRWAVQAYPYTLPDAYVPQVDDELEAGAKAYLRQQEAAVKGVDVSAFVVRGAIADGLLDFIDKEAVDLVVMTTHARGGLARAALGSVADRVLQSPAPVLLIRPA